MADKVKPKKIKKQSALSKYLSQRRSYLVGVALGILLITVNMAVGLYMVSIVIDAENPETINEINQLPVPEINEESYSSFKQDYLNRQTKELLPTVTVNPFRID